MVRSFVGHALALVFCMLGFAYTPAVVHGIDSVTAKEVKKAVEKDKKHLREGETAALVLVTGERVGCVFLAEGVNNYRYQRKSDGLFVTTEKKDIRTIYGAVLKSPPQVPVEVEASSSTCKETPRTVYVDVWPKDTRFAEVVPLTSNGN